MTTFAIEQRLQTITIGHTTTINGHAVTRWSTTRYEVDTFGQTSYTPDVATDAIKK